MALLQFCSLCVSQYTDLAAEWLLYNCYSVVTCDMSPVARICISITAVTLGNSAFFPSGVYLSALCDSRYKWKNVGCKCSRIWC
jgi:hypothetical protein